MPLLQVSDLQKRFGATIALAGVDLAVEPGEVHALIGENGAGKSTLLNILSGGMRPDSGVLRFSDRAYAPLNPAAARRSGMAHIHQELSLAPHLSVAENIVLGAEPRWMGIFDRKAAIARARQLLAGIGHPDLDPTVLAGRLPLASQQLVEICRALAWDSRLVLMDEPTSSLQRADVDRLFRLVQQLQARGIGVIYVSHFLEEVREIATSFTVLRDGRSVARGRLSDVTDGELIAGMIGRELAQAPSAIASDALSAEPPAPPAPASANVLLAVDGLASLPGLKHASFELRAGEVLGIAGLVGSGRTTLVRALFGLRPSRGDVRLHDGIRSNRATPARRVGEGVGFVSEDRKGEGLALAMSIADNLTLSDFGTCARAGWLDLRAQSDSAQKIMDRLRVKAATPSVLVGRLSGGNQQKVLVGRLLHQNARILLLDEPTRGIDVGSKAEIHACIRQLAREGNAVLVVSSYIPELLAVCDRIAVMRRGRLSPARPVSQWTGESILEEAVLGGQGTLPQESAAASSSMNNVH